MEPNTEFFSQEGRPICFSSEGGNIHLWSGQAVAYTEREKVYAYNGRFLGWYEDGWLYDRNNHPALFSREVNSGPPRPSFKPTSQRGTPRYGGKASKKVSHSRPSRHSTWSEFADQSYFTQEEEVPEAEE